MAVIAVPPNNAVIGRPVPDCSIMFALTPCWSRPDRGCDEANFTVPTGNPGVILAAFALNNRSFRW